MTKLSLLVLASITAGTVAGVGQFAARRSTSLALDGSPAASRPAAAGDLDQETLTALRQEGIDLADVQAFRNAVRVGMTANNLQTRLDVLAALRARYGDQAVDAEMRQLAAEGVGDGGGAGRTARILAWVRGVRASLARMYDRLIAEVDR